MIEIAGMILAALLLTWGMSVIDRTPEAPYFTYPCPALAEHLEVCE